MSVWCVDCDVLRKVPICLCLVCRGDPRARVDALKVTFASAESADSGGLRCRPGSAFLVCRFMLRGSMRKCWRVEGYAREGALRRRLRYLSDSRNCVAPVTLFPLGQPGIHDFAFLSAVASVLSSWDLGNVEGDGD